MIELSLDTVKTFLQSKGFDVHYQEETNQLYMLVKVANFDFPLFIRVYDEGDLLQLIQFIPISVQPGTAGDLARLLHTLNKEIDIPGFGMDETSNVVFYRVMIPSFNKQIEEGLIEIFMSTLPVIAESFSPIIMTAASGNATYEEIMKKMQDIENT